MNEKSLLYLASMGIRKEYRTLPLDLICLVDYAFKEKVRFIEKKTGPSYLKLGLDVIDAIIYLKEREYKFDYLVIINDGLLEGGGIYPLHTDTVLGLALTVVKDRYIHIGDLTYYRRNVGRINRFDLPYNKKLLLPGDEGYIDPLIFSGFGSDAKVFLMEKSDRTKTIELPNGKKIHFMHDTFWNYYENLDLIFYLTRSTRKTKSRDKFYRLFKKILEHTQFIDKNEKVIIEKVFHLVESSNAKKIGFTPYRDSHSKIMDYISKSDSTYPQEIYFFHLNEKDFKDIYHL